MKTTATPQEVLAKTYLNISDIQTLLGMTKLRNLESLMYGRT